MNKILFMTLVTVSSLTVSAQETYENAILANEDLNGTARYVGMGGALEALGADISTIGSNPAGIGLFRKIDHVVVGVTGHVGLFQLYFQGLDFPLELMNTVMKLLFGLT